jgi:hypothetical protein
MARITGGIQMKILILLLSLLFPASAWCEVHFFQHKDCEGESFTMVKGDKIKTLKEVTYIGTCWSMLPGGQDFDYDCELHFDNEVSSVEITDDEDVLLFKHRNFEGRVLRLNDGNGCYYIGWRMEDEVSSAIVK